MTTGPVLVTGVGRSGVRTLVEGIGLVDPALRLGGLPLTDGAELATVDDLGKAAVALLVIDPSSIVGDEERAMLDILRARVASVGVVCSKVDAFWDWPTNAKASRKVLDPRGELPMFAVSAAAALAGAVDESGLEDLAEWITENARPQPQPTPASTRAPAPTPAPTPSMPAPPAPTVSSAPDADGLAQTRARLVRMRDRGRSDRLAAVRGGLTTVRARAGIDLGAGIRAINTTAREALVGIDSRGIDDYTEWVRASVQALRDRLTVTVTDEVDRVRAAALLGIEPARPTPTVADLPPLALRPHAVRRRGIEDAGVIIFGASLGLAAGRLVVAPLEHVQTLQWIAMPLALMVGVVLAVSVMRVRRISAVREQLRVWTGEALAEARVGVDHDLNGQITAADAAIGGQIMRHYERRSRMIGDDIAAIDAKVRGRNPTGTGSGAAASNR
ncbi:hypothetical protein [Williamsia sp. CHRR-6]|uniref:hypothetical protein n=1 Tax=Williamsia sp. CHRR-6 TaxID=2835871 RepID=UPI001BDB002B|nr:hypothetical protein [Williamsia sp. CHRR-6]MBT0567488.1 hypothetical protein [Williamsia sp. CHRR-6]